MPVFVQSQHLDRNVPRRRVLFQMVEHGPAQHVREEHIQRNRGGMEFARQGQRFRAIHRHQDLETLVVRQDRKARAHSAGHLRRSAGLHRPGCRFSRSSSRVQSPTRRQLLPAGVAGSRSSVRYCNRSCGGADIGLWQIQGERAALAGRAAQLDFATQQAGQFATDGKPQTSSAVLAAGAGICLLEGLEDDSLLLGGIPIPVSETSNATTDAAVSEPDGRRSNRRGN